MFLNGKKEIRSHSIWNCPNAWFKLCVITVKNVYHVRLLLLSNLDLWPILNKTKKKSSSSSSMAITSTIRSEHWASLRNMLIHFHQSLSQHYFMHETNRKFPHQHIHTSKPIASCAAFNLFPNFISSWFQPIRRRQFVPVLIYFSSLRVYFFSFCIALLCYTMPFLFQYTQNPYVFFHSLDLFEWIWERQIKGYRSF